MRERLRCRSSRWPRCGQSLGGEGRFRVVCDTPRRTLLKRVAGLALSPPPTRMEAPADRWALQPWLVDATGTVEAALVLLAACMGCSPSGGTNMRQVTAYEIVGGFFPPHTQVPGCDSPVDYVSVWRGIGAPRENATAEMRQKPARTALARAVALVAKHLFGGSRADSLLEAVAALGGGGGGAQGERAQGASAGVGCRGKYWPWGAMCASAHMFS